MALAIFRERNRIRKDLWARHDVEDHIRMVKEKIERVEINLNDHAPDFDIAVDDALDAINFLGFIVRRLKGLTPDGGTIPQ